MKLLLGGSETTDAVDEDGQLASVVLPFRPKLGWPTRTFAHRGKADPLQSWSPKFTPILRQLGEALFVPLCDIYLELFNLQQIYPCGKKTLILLPAA